MLEVDVLVLKLVNYTVAEIIERKCYFLPPFISSLHEKYFALYNEDEEKLDGYLQEQMQVLHILKETAEAGYINEYAAYILKILLNAPLTLADVQKLAEEMQGL